MVITATDYDDVIQWKHLPRYWLFVRGIHRPSVVSLTKASDTSLEVFFDLRLNTWLGKQSRRQ